jgi:hypothetical protein
MSATKNYQVVFPDWYDERGEWEAREKGWLQGVEVRFGTGDSQSLFFYDPVRLAQDLDAESKQGKPFVAVPGLIVIPEVTREAITRAVNGLVESGYFQVQKGAA